MDYLNHAFDYFNDWIAWYRHMAYYYIGYHAHEYRLQSASSKNKSKKFVAVRDNDIEEIQANLFNGNWQVNDIVSINNMTTMLHEAVVLDRRSIFDFLLRQGADPNVRDRNGMTPLLKAAALGREHMVIELLKCGVNPHHRDPHGFTPLQKAILHEEWKVVTILSGLGNYTKSPTTWLWPPDI
ncbi:unnamed protein product [Blepharisma stoltei]|uniref:Uncharacterized protein n=1 Tax=Blepharisma stoltei TaxID=1481888 RepID=A0AAU9KG81_9CILI|nr:unnamed protein product [Blepharisma stoltei]